MEQTFEIPVHYKGTELMFPAEVFRYGYVHRIQITVEGQVIFLEKDEENNYRVIADATNTKEPDKDLVQAIIFSIEAILK